jgi:dihydroorotate dehydrogenase (fumarate)
MSTVDLTTTYLGLDLRNPLVASASPLSEEIDNIVAMEDAGIAAIVMHSLFEEQLSRESHRIDRYLDYGSESFAEALTYFPEPASFRVGPEEYLDKIRRAKERVGIPIIGSLNGISPGGWTRYARLMQDAGADAIELNVYYLSTDSARTAVEVEDRYLDVVRAVRMHIDVPLSVKIGPYFSSLPHFITRLENEGTDGVVLFNRFYQPDFDLSSFNVVPRISLSSSRELLLRLRWVALLFARCSCDLAVSGGIHNHRDVLKSMMAGASAACSTSALLARGIIHASDMIRQLEAWMVENEYTSIRQMQGSMSEQNVREPSALARANYMKTIHSWQSSGREASTGVRADYSPDATVDD